MCESESGFKAFFGWIRIRIRPLKAVGFGFGFKKNEKDSDSCGFGFKSAGCGSGFEMPGFGIGGIAVTGTKLFISRTAIGDYHTIKQLHSAIFV